MKTYYSETVLHHAPVGEMNRGAFVPPYESPERASNVAQAVRAAGFGPLIEPTVFPDCHVERVHDAGFVRFLAEAHDRWLALGRDGDAAPMCWPGEDAADARTWMQLDAQLGAYCFDVMTPISAGSWRAARTSVDVALSGAALLASGQDRAAFALCRPPGHHAGLRTYGGYCFLNNVAVAAQFLLDQGAKRIAIFDPDYHHGNGTQQIFYGRSDVLYASIHADPVTDFPFYTGFVDETGAGEGTGYNLNLPLERGAGWDAWGSALDEALTRIARYRPDVVLVSLGVDMLDGDPLSHFRFQPADFGRLGKAIATLDLPTLFVMEGGYAIDGIGDAVVRTLAAFLGD